MPLVSGVCRVASAPMLSHGGSRLNASKPEANPKTSCPTLQTTKTFRFFAETKNLCWNEIVAFRKTFSLWKTTKKNVFGKRLSFPVPLSGYAKLTFKNLRENPKGKPLHIQKKSNRLSNESSIPLSRWREVHEKFTRFFFSFTFLDF